MSSNLNISRKKTSHMRVKNDYFYWNWALPPPLTVTFHVITFLFLLLFYFQMWHLQPKATLMLWSEWVNWPVRVKDPKIWVSDWSHLMISPVFCPPLSVCLSLRVVAFGLGHIGLFNKQHRFVIHRRHPTSASCAGEAFRGTRVGWCRRCFF